MLVNCLLDGAEDRSDFPIERGKIEVDDTAARVENDIDRAAEGGEVFANGLSHPPLDTVAIDRLAHDLPDGQAHARSRVLGVTERRAVRPKLRAQRVEVAHLPSELLTAGLIHALIVNMFAEAKRDGGFCFAGVGHRWRGGGHVLILVGAAIHA